MRTGSTHCIVCGNKLREADLAVATKHPKMFTCADDECMIRADIILKIALTDEELKKVFGEPR
jgi:hypothetical protein